MVSKNKWNFLEDLYALLDILVYDCYREPQKRKKYRDV